MNVRSSGFRYLAIVLINALFWHPVLVLAEGIVVSPGVGNTRLDRAGNGVPIIDIATPNGRGLSHNTFSDYNVDKQGVVLNNATGKWQETQLAGQIVGNPNLRDRAAKLIVNEVNGGNPSRLAGYTEVAGAKANVVVANPYGISCDGCGFINSPRVTLSTGKPVFDNGELDHYAVDRGSVSVEGLGLDATQVDQFDIITRAARINADIHAHRLDIVTGANDVDADTLQATARKGAQARPELAIDSSALGGMYADRISLVGTEAGVGVRVAGDMAASAGDIAIDAAGHLTLSDTQASRRVAIKAASAETSGRLRGELGTAINTRGDMVIHDAVSSAGDITLTAGGKLTQQGQVVAGVSADKRVAGRHITLTAGALENRGRLDATQRLDIEANTARNTGQWLASEIAVHADRSLNNRGDIRGQRTVLETASLHNEATIAAKETLDLRTPRIVNRSLLRFGRGQDVSLVVEHLDNGGGQFQLDAAALTLDASSLINDAGVVHADRLSLSGHDLSNRKGGLLDASKGDARLDFTGRIDNEAGRIQARRALQLDGGNVVNRHGEILADAVSASAVTFDNAHGLISGRAGNAAISVTQDIDNTQGSIEAQGALDLVAASLHNAAGRLLGARVGIAAKTLNNSAGTISAQQGDLSIRSPGKLDNSQGHLQAAQGAAKIVAGTFINRGGDLLGRGLDVSINHSLNNTAGRLAATTDTLALDVAGDLDNTHGELRGQRVRLDLGALTGNAEGLIAAEVGDLDLTTRGDLNSAAGRLQAQQDLTLVAGRSIDNSSGNIVADRIDIDGIDLRNQRGVVSAETGDLGVKLGQRLDNSGGHLQAVSGNAHLNLGSLSNQHGVVSARAVTISTRGDIDNGSGHLTAEQGALVLDSAGALGNVGGSIDAGEKALRLVTAGTVDNTDGVVRGGAVDIDIGSLARNRGGLISADTGDLELVSPGRLDSAGGQIQAAGNLTLTSESDISTDAATLLAQRVDLHGHSLSNQGGTLSAEAEDLAIEVAAGVDNRGGQLQAARHLELTAGETIDNQEGVLVAQNMAIEGRSLHNRKGAISAEQGALGIQLDDALDNSEGRMQALSGAMQLATGTLTNERGDISAASLAIVAEDGITNAAGQMAATQGDLRLQASDDIDNVGGRLVAEQGDTRIGALGGIDNTQGVILGQNVNLDVGELSANAEGLISAEKGELGIIAKRLLSNAGGQLQALHRLMLNSDGDIVNDAGTMIADDIEVSSRNLSNREGAVSAETGDLGVKLGQRLDNSDGHLQAASGKAQLALGSLFNQHGVVSARAVTISTRGDIDNGSGHLTAEQGAFVLDSAGALGNVGGSIDAGEKALRLVTAGTVDNTDGVVRGGAVDIDIGSLARNRGGLISADTGDLELVSPGTLDGAGGQIQAAGDLTLTSESDISTDAATLIAQRIDLHSHSLSNQGGTLSAEAEALAIEVAAGVDNRGGQFQAARDLALTAGGDIDNREGVLIAQDIAIEGRSLQNRKGGVSAEQGALGIQLDEALDNSEGRIQALSGAMQLATGTLTNERGDISAASLSIDAKDDVSNAAGQMMATQGDLRLQASGDIYNAGGWLVSEQGEARIGTPGGIDNTQGVMLGQNVNLDVGELSVNAGGLIAAEVGDLDLTTRGDLNSAAGRLQAQQDLTLVAGRSIDNSSGNIVADRIDIDGIDLRNQQGVISAEKGDLNVKLGQRLDNSDGHLQAASGKAQLALGSLSNQHGVVSARSVNISTRGNIDNGSGRLVAEQGELVVDSAGLLGNVGGSINAGDEALHVVTAGAIDNTDGVLRGGAVNLEFGSLARNRGGLISADTGDLELVSPGTLDGAGGQMQAAGDLTLTSESDISTDAATLIAQRIDVRGHSLSNQGGTLSAEAEALAIEVAAGVDNRGGQLQAARHLALTAGGDIDNREGVLIAQDIAIEGRSLQNRKGGISADQGALGIQLDDALDNSEGRIQALSGAMQLATGTLTNERGDISAASLSIDAKDDVSNAAGQMMATQGDLRLQASGDIDSVGGWLVSEQGDARIGTPGAIDNIQGVILGQNVHLDVGELSGNRAGLISAEKGELGIIAKGVLNNAGGQLQALHRLALNSGGTIDNQTGRMVADQIDIHGEALDNGHGVISAEQGELSVKLDRKLDNSDGHLQALAGDANFDIGAFTNTHGVASADAISLDAREDIDNDQGRIVAGAGDLVLKTRGALLNRGGLLLGDTHYLVAASLANGQKGVIGARAGDLEAHLQHALGNDSGLVQAARSLSLEAGEISNRDGRLLAHDITLSGTTLDNREAGLVSAEQGDATLTLSQRLDNDGGHLQASGRLQYQGDELSNRQGRIVADALAFSSASLANTGGLIAANAAAAAIEVSGALDNTEGQIQAQDLLSVHTASLDNTDGTLVANGVALDAEEIVNRGGAISADQDDLQIDVSGAFNNGGGLLQAINGAVSLVADSFTNHSGNLIGQQVRADITHTLDNGNGRLVAEGAGLAITAGGALDNTRGVLRGDAVQLDIGSLEANAEGLVSADDGDLRVISHGGMNNTGGQLQALHQLTLAAKDAIDNQSGTVIADRLDIQSDSLNNHAGVVSAEQGDIALNLTGLLNNQSGHLQAREGRADISLGSADNREGVIAADEIALQAAGDMTNAGGLVVAENGDLTLGVSGELDNGAGTLSGHAVSLLTGALGGNANGLIAALTGDMDIHADSALDNAGGQIQAAKNLSVTADDVTNRRGRFIADTLTLDARAMDNAAGGIVSAERGDAELVVSQRLNNDDGALQATGALSYRGGDLSSRRGSILADRLTLNAESLSNREGLISATGASADLTVTGVLDNTQGRLQAGKTLKVDSRSLSNDKGVVVADDVALSNRSLSNTDGIISAERGTLDLRTQGVLDNTEGTLRAAKGSLGVTAVDMRNGHGALAGQRVDLTLDNSLDNRAGSAVAAGALNVTLGKLLDNTAATLRAASVTLKTGNFLNAKGGLVSADAGNLKLVGTEALSNAGGKLQALDSLDVESQGAFDNTGGTLVADRVGVSATRLNNRQGIVSAEKGDLNIDLSQLLDNAQGHLQAGSGSAGLKAAALTNTRGVIAARAIDLDVQGNTANQAGKIVAGQGNLRLRGQGALDNTRGTLAGRALDVSVNAIDNGNGLIAALAAAAKLQVRHALANAGGQIQAKQGLTLEAAEVDNQGGHLLGRDVQMTAATLNNGDQGVVSAATGDATLTLSQGLDNDAGRIEARHGQLSLPGGIPLSNRGGTLLASHLKAETTSLDNRSGQILADRLDLQAETLDNREGGLVAAGKAGALIRGDTLINGNGQVQAEGVIDLAIDHVDNRHGAVVADTIQMQQGVLRNDSGALLSGKGGILLDLLGNIANRNGLIEADGGEVAIEGRSGKLDNRAGSIRGNRLTITTASVDNREQGQLVGDSEGVAVATRTLDNRDGQILSRGGDLVVKAAQGDNRGGVMQGSQVDLSGETFDNGEDGLVASLAGRLKVVLQRYLGNDGGRMIAKGTLDIDPPKVDNHNGQMAGDLVRLEAGDLDNSNGVVEAQRGLTLDAGELNNRSGSLRALGGAQSVVSVSGALDNRQGTIELASRDMALKAAQLINTAGSAIHAGSGVFELTLAALDNANGELKGTGALKARVDDIAGIGKWQANGPLELVTQDAMTLAADDRLASANDLTLEAASLDNAGELLANGDLRLTSHGDITNSGLVSSRRDMRIAGDDLSQQGGRLASGGNATYRLTGTLDNRGRLIGSGGVDIEAADIDNRGTLGSQQNLRLVSRGSIDNQADTLLFSGGDMTLRGNALFNRYADIYSAGNLDFARNEQGMRAERLENRSGTIESEGDIQLQVDNLINTRDVFEANQTSSMKIERRVQPSGRKYYYCSGRCEYTDHVLTETKHTEIQKNSPSSTLIAGNDLTVQSGGLVSNQYSLMGANNNVLINAQTFSNRGADLEDSTRVRTYRARLYRRGGRTYDRAPDREFVKQAVDPWVASNGLDKDGNPLPNPMTRENYREHMNSSQVDLTLLSDTTEHNSNGGGAAATVQAGNKVAINASNRIDNGGITTQKRAQIDGNLAQSNSNGPIAKLDYTLASRVDTAAAIAAIDKEKAQRRQLLKSSDDIGYRSVDNSSEVAAARSGVDGTSVTNQPSLRHEGAYAKTDMASISDDIVAQTYRQADGQNAAHSVQTRDVKAIESSVASWSDADDVRTSIERNHSSAAASGNGKAIAKRNPVLLSRGGDGSETITVQRNIPLETSLSPMTGSDDGKGVAKQNMALLPRGDKGSETITLQRNIPIETSLPSEAGSEGGKGATKQGMALLPRVDNGSEAITVRRNTPVEASFSPVDYSNADFERVTPAKLPTFRLPQGDYGLFIQNPSPKSHYLIETNPEFTSVDRVKGSDYLLEKLGYTDDSAYRLLGDGRYESRLIRDAVQTQTGSRFLDTRLTDDADQYRYLMDNAIAASDSLNLTPGVALTPSQTAALTHDIVWMEPQQVAGETVLAPVLYLAKVTERNVRGNSLIQGRDIDLIAGDDLANVGTIRASRDLNASSGGSILQAGLMAAGNNLKLTAKDNIYNNMAGEIRGRTVDLTTLKGDIVNDRLAAQSGSKLRYDTVLDQGGLIAATDGLSISAGRDLVNRSDMISGGDIDLNAMRNLRLDAVQDISVDDSSDGFSKYQSVRSLGGRINALGSTRLNAGSNIDVIASRVEAGKNISAFAGQDLRVLSAEDIESKEIHYHSSTTDKDVVDTHTRQQGSELSAGGDLSLMAGNDLTAQASRLKAGDQAYLVGGNDVSLVAANDEDYHYYYKKKKSGGLISRKSMKRDEVTDTRAVGTTVETGGDLTIASGGDQTYEAARLDSGGDLSLTSGGGITFAGALDTHTESHEKSKSNWAWQSAKGKGQTDQTLRQSELLARGQTLIQTADGLNIDISQVDQQTVSQAIDAMVTANPDLAWLEQAEARGDIDWRTVKEIHDSWDYSQSGLGQGAALAISIAAAAIAGPAAAGAVSAIGGGGLAAAMAAGAAGSLAGTAAVGVINHRGHLGATFSDTLSSDSLKSAVTAAASAGVAKGLDSVWGGSTDPVTGRTVGVDLDSASGWGRFAGQRASQALAEAGIDTAVQGGSFGDHFRTRLQNATSTVLQATLFNQVGNLGLANDLADGGSEKVALHALAGGLAAAASGGDFKSGALAAGANEALVEQLATLVDNDPQLLTAASQITGIVAAGLADGDVQQGAEIAGNATTYNYLAHPEAKRLQEINRLLEDDDSLSETQRQSLEEERLGIHTLSQSRDLALEQACGQGGSAQACRYERAQLQVAMDSWQDVKLGRDDRDTVLAEYTHTATQYGEHQQQRMERIGAEALSEMVVDSASAPIIMGQIVGQALQGDEESQALLQAMGQDVKAFAANPVNYITEKNREQLAQADALEQAGKQDEADKLRVRVALESESMLMGAGGLVARLPRMAKSIVTSRLDTARAGLPNNGINYDTITTAGSKQATAPRNLTEQIVWNGVLENPNAGRPLSLSKDPRFRPEDGFQKMEVTTLTESGRRITIHYQYNSNTGRPYDMKIVFPPEL
ncbi:filamentous hemagglutinin N-terminal domain-containing protein [Salinicola endophyticus]|uniref:Filamentous hemagglutinin N-terminal domain-containing protein n=1 Tax=Salinicola endophyticus TaxID=1949083 RepID=A0ABY8FHS9_9GAMM|nr:filamentous hemagglutinin N-terminal domain-containing protein [Salinicola endophyticus]WFF41183.1 filamentous hemagglutinin N-terminal domain-containing protein [Salinicola endophyticus]